MRQLLQELSHLGLHYLQATRQLSESDYNFIKECFKTFDKDSNGCISKKELRNGLQKCGRNPTEQDVDNMMNELGINGEIHFDDFERCMKVMLEDTDFNQEEELRKAFKVFDKDGNGFIDKSELGKALKELGEKLTDEEVNELFKEADENGDGKIQYDEFIRTLAP